MCIDRHIPNGALKLLVSKQFTNETLRNVTKKGPLLQDLHLKCYISFLFFTFAFVIFFYFTDTKQKPYKFKYGCICFFFLFKTGITFTGVLSGILVFKLRTNLERLTVFPFPLK